MTTHSSYRVELHVQCADETAIIVFDCQIDPRSVGGGKKHQQLEIIMGKTQVINNQVIIHLIHEGTTHQGEIQTLLKLDTSEDTD